MNSNSGPIPSKSIKKAASFTGGLHGLALPSYFLAPLCAAALSALSK